MLFRTIALALFALCISSSFAFAETLTFECSYSTYSDKDGNHKAEDGFMLTFLLDMNTGKSYIIGNNGSEELTTFKHPNGHLSFLEVTVTGNLMTTAIGNDLSSVHSRNTFVSSGLVPTQYYGKCTKI